MAESPPTEAAASEAERWIDVDAAQANLPVRVGEHVGPELVLRRVGLGRELGLVLVVEHSPTGKRVRLTCAPRASMPQHLAAHGDVAVSALDDITHEIAQAIRAALPALVGDSPRLRAASRRELLQIAPPAMRWADSLAETPGSLKISDHCDEACAFCSSPRTGYAEGSAMPEPELVRDRLVAWAGQGLRALQFVDREPTLNPRLAEYIALARDLHFTEIRINSNGVSLGDGRRIADYVRAGLTELCISLHSSDAASSDRITGRDGGFQSKLAAIRAALQYPIAVTVNVVLTAENFAGLPELARFVGHEFAHVRPREVANEARRLGRGMPEQAGLVVSFVGPVGDGAEHAELLPRYRDCVPRLCEALDAGRHVTVHTAYALPPCVLPASRRERVFPSTNAHRYEAPMAGRTYLPSCATCVLRPRCAGIWSAYVDRFGPDEFVPVD